MQVSDIFKCIKFDQFASLMSVIVRSAEEFVYIGTKTSVINNVNENYLMFWRNTNSSRFDLLTIGSLVLWVVKRKIESDLLRIVRIRRTFHYSPHTSLP